jgi:hypothetical protein
MNVDVPWSVGFIAGAATAGLLCNAAGVGGILRLVIIIACGVGCGVLGDFIAKRSRGPR